MSKQLQLKIITPEKLILDELVDSVTLPTTGGEITILPDHVPLIANLSSGDIVARTKGEIIPMEIVGGFIDIKNNSKGQTEVKILADFAEHISAITEEEIARAKAKAEELRKQSLDKEVVDYEHFNTELERSLTTIKIGNKWKNKKYRK